MLRNFILCMALILPKHALSASIVTEWLDVAVPAANVATTEPTAAARFYYILFTAMCDAWSAYDGRAVATMTGDTLRGTGGAANDVNRREAISNAAYQVMLHLAKVHISFADDFMARQGYDPKAMTPPAILGRKMADILLSARMDDGANEQGGYLDPGHWTFEDPAVVSSWQPVSADTMRTELQVPVTPHWGGLPPFAIGNGDAFRPPAPPQSGTAEWDKQISTLLDTSANLDDQRKATAEYWANFISQPPSHLVILTKCVSLRDDMRLDDDIAMFFAVGNALYDTSIASWDAKYHYDYLRPVNGIRRLGRKVMAWDSPNHNIPIDKLSNDGKALAWGNVRRTVEMDAKDWYPYLPTPPFPSYVSGHSAFTEAWAETMRKVTGSDHFGFSVEWPKLFVENRWLTHPVVLSFDSFEAAALSSGQSRIYAGVHWPVDDIYGHQMGRGVAEKVWQRTESFLDGQAHPAMEPILALDRRNWSHRSSGQGETLFESAEGGLSIRIAPSPGAVLSGRWQTRPLDPMPEGTYKFVATIDACFGNAGQWSLAVESTDAESLLGITKKSIDSAAPISIASLTVTLNGTEPFRLVFAGQSDHGPATFKLLNLTCQWIARDPL